VTPTIETGFTALSEEMFTNRRTPAAAEATAIVWVPPTLFSTASSGWCSIIGTCL
jgi:hypothetical protein